MDSNTLDFCCQNLWSLHPRDSKFCPLPLKTIPTGLVSEVALYRGGGGGVGIILEFTVYSTFNFSHVKLSHTHKLVLEYQIGEILYHESSTALKWRSDFKNQALGCSKYLELPSNSPENMMQWQHQFRNCSHNALFGKRVFQFFQFRYKVKAYRSAFPSVFLFHPRFKTCTCTTRFFTVKRRHVMVRHFDLDWKYVM